jgi:transcriptional regulator with XRE-family HTH domain
MKSIGQTLKSARLKKNYTIEDVRKFIKIHPSYIKAMENDNYSIFDGKVHSKGFLKIYVEFLELDLDELLALWRREYASTFDKKKDEKFSKLKALEPERFVITPSVLTITFVVAMLLVFFIYLFMQYRQYTDAPKLDIYYPEDNIVVEDDVLDLTGKVELDSEVFINNQKILANPDGSFITSIKLREGINTISVKSVNKLNKETEAIRTIIYRPEREEIVDVEEVIEELEPILE